MLRATRELNSLIAREVMGYEVFTKNKRLFEKTPEGERPLRNYDSDMNQAWEVAEKMNITIIPIKEEGWFAFVGQEGGWNSPAEFLKFLGTGNFVGCGAAIAKTPTKAICHAALNALDRRRSETTPADIFQAPPVQEQH